ncbi:hypothetical protein F1737_06090 [Methanoplanus sp. FWC-SCC4]|uniref:Uncharacterized protein n=1 Tax=Methanochimaera problematica TaxID=2609417 RepID=A0AA97FC98_9EURY|nr:hypothetical protein [Methanoplanus sp. FWC-SCC4]WOF16314.1 hypothetical protein F1737_06090 [Methanoplanus sp. FWC-SCC4]
MADTRSFARDWQLMKLSRNWKPDDRSGEILKGLLTDASPEIMKKVSEISYGIGQSDAEKIVERMQQRMELLDLFEGMLIVSGIDYKSVEEDGSHSFILKKEIRQIISCMDVNTEISASYIRGFITRIAPGADISDIGEYFKVELKNP